MQVILVCGVNTGVGKTLISGHLLAQQVLAGQKVASYKPVQTGAKGYSPDLAEHHQIVKDRLAFLDKPQLLSNFVGDSHCCGYILETPASPHLAAAKQQVFIDFKKLVGDLHDLVQKRYEFNPYLKQFSTEYHKLDTLLIELAGGVCSPITYEYTNLDLIKVYRDYCRENDIDFKVVYVTGGTLGALSLTLSDLEVLPQVDVVYWNNFLGQCSTEESPAELDAEIKADNFAYLQKRQELLRRDLADIASAKAQQSKNQMQSHLALQAHQVKVAQQLAKNQPLTHLKKPQTPTSGLNKATFNVSEYFKANPTYKYVRMEPSFSKAKLVKFNAVGDVEGDDTL